MPRGMKAPKDCPAEPLKWKWMVSSGNPAGPWRRVTSLPVMVPTTRLVLRMGSVARTGFNTNRVVGTMTGSEVTRSEEHTSELQSRPQLVCRLLLEKKKNLAQ